LAGKPTGKRPLGRLRHGWQDSQNMVYINPIIRLKIVHNFTVLHISAHVVRASRHVIKENPKICLLILRHDTGNAC
jgi:hypothetical protein